MGYWQWPGELGWLERGWLALLPIFGAVFSLVAIVRRKRLPVCRPITNSMLTYTLTRT
jgi:hypothetical protein